MLEELMRELSSLNLGPMAQCLRDWTHEDANVDRSHVACVRALVDALTRERAETRSRRFMARSRLSPAIALAGVTPSATRGLSPRLLDTLSTLDWATRGQSLVITGISSSGKTYLAGALAREATEKRMTVEYCRVPELLDKCDLAKQAGKDALDAFLKPLVNARVLVLDEFATEEAGIEHSRLLCRLIKDRTDARPRSTLVVSPNAIIDWGRYFADETASSALFSRLAGPSLKVALTEVWRASPLRGRQRPG
jgi:hypothetical protein